MTIKFDDKGLVPAIIQDASTKDVLMLGYMNQEAWETTHEKGLVTFFSRSKQRLWTKGETSNNFLEFVSAEIDCDNDTLLIQANPKGPTCHTGTDTCFGNKPAKGFLYDLERVIAQRQESADEESYTLKLLNKGPKKIAQKVGEESIELILEVMDKKEDLFKEESADFFYHYLVLLRSMGLQLSDIEEVLQKRHQ